MNTPKPKLTDTEFEEYLQRLQLTREELFALTPEQQLYHLTERHTQSIPFGNIHVMEGRSVEINLSSIFQKLVRDQQGGYCFEQNLLLFYVCRYLKFPVELQGSRVVLSDELPFTASHELTHVFLFVRVPVDHEENSQVFLLDVGFGGHGPVHPVRFDTANPTTSFGSVFSFASRVERTPVLHNLRTLWYLTTTPQNSEETGKTLFLYEMDMTREVILEDIRLANYWISTHPDSIFTRNLFVSGVRRRGDDWTRVSLWNLRKTSTNLTTHKKTSTTLDSPSELFAALSEISLRVEISSCETLFRKLQSHAGDTAPINA